MSDDWLDVWNATYVKRCLADKFRRLVGGLVPDALDFVWLATGPSAFPEGPLQNKRDMLWALYYLQKAPEDEDAADVFVDVGQTTFLTRTDDIIKHWGLQLQIVRISTSWR